MIETKEDKNLKFIQQKTSENEVPSFNTKKMDKVKINLIKTEDNELQFKFFFEKEYIFSEEGFPFMWGNAQEGEDGCLILENHEVLYLLFYFSYSDEVLVFELNRKNQEASLLELHENFRIELPVPEDSEDIGCLDMSYENNTLFVKLTDGKVIGYNIEGILGNSITESYKSSRYFSSNDSAKEYENSKVTAPVESKSANVTESKIPVPSKNVLTKPPTYIKDQFRTPVEVKLTVEEKGEKKKVPSKYDSSDVSTNHKIFLSDTKETEDKKSPVVVKSLDINSDIEEQKSEVKVTESTAHLVKTFDDLYVLSSSKMKTLKSDLSSLSERINSWQFSLPQVPSIEAQEPQNYSKELFSLRVSLKNIQKKADRCKELMEFFESTGKYVQTNYKSPEMFDQQLLLKREFDSILTKVKDFNELINFIKEGNNKKVLPKANYKNISYVSCSILHLFRLLENFEYQVDEWFECYPSISNNNDDDIATLCENLKQTYLLDEIKFKNYEVKDVEFDESNLSDEQKTKIENLISEAISSAKKKTLLSKETKEISQKASILANSAFSLESQEKPFASKFQFPKSVPENVESSPSSYKTLNTSRGFNDLKFGSLSNPVNNTVPKKPEVSLNSLANNKLEHNPVNTIKLELSSKLDGTPKSTHSDGSGKKDQNDENKAETQKEVISKEVRSKEAKQSEHNPEKLLVIDSNLNGSSSEPSDSTKEAIESKESKLLKSPKKIDEKSQKISSLDATEEPRDGKVEAPVKDIPLLFKAKEQESETSAKDGDTKDTNFETKSEKLSANKLEPSTSIESIEMDDSKDEITMDGMDLGTNISENKKNPLFQVNVESSAATPQTPLSKGFKANDTFAKFTTPEQKPSTASQWQNAGSFGSAKAFGSSPSQAFGQPAFNTSFGQPSFGQPSFGQSSFGENNSLNPTFGQQSTIGGGSQMFGQSGFNFSGESGFSTQTSSNQLATKTIFGGNTGGISFGQLAQTGGGAQMSFGNIAQNQNTNVFGTPQGGSIDKGNPSFSQFRG